MSPPTQNTPPNALIDPRQRLEIGDRHALVDLVHGLADQAELDHRAVVLDEARVRGAAGGRELGRTPGLGLDRRADEVDERRPAAVRKLSLDGRSDGVADAVAGGGLAASRSISASRLAVSGVVEADVEARARLGGNDVDGRVADVDRGDLEVRGVEMRGAGVERRRRSGRSSSATSAAHRVVGEVRIGDVALHAVRSACPVSEPRRPILIMSPSGVGLVGSPTRQWSKRSPRSRRPVEQLHGAVDGRAFLVAGDEEGDRAAGVRRGGEKSRAAATKRRRAPFMSTAPRP